MRTLNFNFTGYEGLEAFVSDNHIPNSPLLLIQIFDGRLDRLQIQNLLKYLSAQFDKAHIIGASTNGEIVGDSICDNTLILSFSVFDTTALVSTDVTLESGSLEAGKLLGQKAADFGAQAMILFTNPFAANGDLLIEGIGKTNPDVIVAGGMAGDNGSFQSTYVICKTDVSADKAVAVMLRGDHLRVGNGYSFHWLPIGPKFTVTHAVDNKIYTLDDQPIISVYRDYLGDSVADTLPSVGVAFPLIFQKEGNLIGRAPVIAFEDGALGFEGNIPQGSEVQFGVGNADLILDASKAIVDSCLTHSPETIFVYSCMARRRFLGDAIKEEILPLHAISPLSGFFTYGEFFTDPANRHSSLLNETMSFLLLSESEAQPLHTDIKPPMRTNEWSMVTFRALSHLLNRTTNEFQSINTLLQQRIDLQISDNQTKDEIMIMQSRMAIMGEMIGMIAHQWRQPITVIGMVTNNAMLDIQMGEFDLERMSDDLSIIDKQVHFLSQTIDDFRNFFRPNKLPQQFTFEDITNEIRVIMGKSFENHNIDILFTGELKASVQTYKNELLQVFLNIFSNAKDAFLENHIENASVICTCAEQDETLLFLIQDNAGGIPIHILHRIFEPYFSTKGEKNGTGLGLYMSSIIVEKHLKGNIRVCSDERGTTFAVQIPKVLLEKVLNVY